MAEFAALSSNNTEEEDIVDLILQENLDSSAKSSPSSSGLKEPNKLNAPFTSPPKNVLKARSFNTPQHSVHSSKAKYAVTPSTNPTLLAAREARLAELERKREKVQKEREVHKKIMEEKRAAAEAKRRERAQALREKSESATRERRRVQEQSKKWKMDRKTQLEEERRERIEVTRLQKEDLARQEAEKKRMSLSLRLREEEERRAASIAEMEAKERQAMQDKQYEMMDREAVLRAKRANAETRRQSLAYRRAEFNRHKLMDEEDAERRVASSQEDIERNREWIEDKAAYTRAHQQRDRQSLLFRTAENDRIRSIEAEEEEMARLLEQEERHLQAMDREDAEAVMEEAKTKGRKSIEYRALESMRVNYLDEIKELEARKQEALERYYRRGVLPKGKRCDEDQNQNQNQHQDQTDKENEEDEEGVENEQEEIERARSCSFLHLEAYKESCEMAKTKWEYGEIETTGKAWTRISEGGKPQQQPQDQEQEHDQEQQEQSVADRKCVVVQAAARQGRESICTAARKRLQEVEKRLEVARADFLHQELTVVGDLRQGAIDMESKREEEEKKKRKDSIAWRYVMQMKARMYEEKKKKEEKEREDEERRIIEEERMEKEGVESLLVKNLIKMEIEARQDNLRAKSRDL